MLLKLLCFIQPPGTGKSHLARAIAGECVETTFFAVSASDLLSKYQGESEQHVKMLFCEARRRRPSVIFIDEIDSLGMARSDQDSDGSRRVKTEIFVQMDGATSDNRGVFVIAATNTPQNLDDALLRRFDKLVYIPLPDTNARCDMLRRGFWDCSKITDPVIQTVAMRTEG